MSQFEETIQQWDYNKSMIEKIMQISSPHSINSLKSILEQFQSQLEIIESFEEIKIETISNDPLFQSDWNNFVNKPQQQDIKSKYNAENKQKKINEYCVDLKKLRKTENSQSTTQEMYSFLDYDYNSSRTQKIVNQENQEIQQSYQDDQVRDHSQTDYYSRKFQYENNFEVLKARKKPKKSNKVLNLSISIQDIFPLASNEEVNELLMNGFSIQVDNHITQKYYLSWNPENKNFQKGIWAGQKKAGFKKQLIGAHQYVKVFMETERKFVDSMSQNSDLNYEQKQYLDIYCVPVLQYLQLKNMQITKQENDEGENITFAQNNQETLIIMWKFNSKKYHEFFSQEDNGELEDKILHYQKRFLDQRNLSFLILPLLSFPLNFVEYSTEEILKVSEDKYKNKNFQKTMIQKAQRYKCKYFSDFYCMDVKNIGLFPIRIILETCKANPEGDLALHFNNLENARLYQKDRSELVLLFYCIFNAIQPSII